MDKKEKYLILCVLASAIKVLDFYVKTSNLEKMLHVDYFNYLKSSCFRCIDNLNNYWRIKNVEF